MCEIALIYIDLASMQKSFCLVPGAVVLLKV